MSLRFFKRLRAGVAVTGAAWLVLAAVPAFGQSLPNIGFSQAEPPMEVIPPASGKTGTRAPQTPQTPEPQAAQSGQPSESDSSFPGESGAATASATTAFAGNTGYIDSAIPRSLIRFRFDAAYDDNRPDRAEFFYAKCGCFGGRAAGPPKAETSIDYQDISTYLEVAADERLSGFIEVPVRFINPDVNDNHKGIADINFGFKYAFIANEGQFATFQFRTYVPTGDARDGLGTDHVSLEPALLLHQPLMEKLALDAELRDWIPIDGSDFAGNVIRYGVGLSYEIYHSCNLRISPVAEVVGWTVLNGKEFDGMHIPPFDAAGDTIINAKLGARVGLGEHNDLYAGYGRALTGQVWYKEIFRIEYRLSF